MDPNIYLNSTVFYRLAQRDQKQKAVPEPEFRQFDLSYLMGAPGKRDHSQNANARSPKSDVEVIAAQELREPVDVYIIRPVEVF